MDQDILSVEIKAKISKYGPSPRPPTVVVELATGEKAMEVFESFAKMVDWQGASSNKRRSLA